MDGCDSLGDFPAGERRQERWQLLPAVRCVHDSAVRGGSDDPGSSPECVLLREEVDYVNLFSV